MKYKDILKFLKDNEIHAIKPKIADQVDHQLEVEISDEEFEEICNKIYNLYMDYVEEPDVWELVNDELVSRGHKKPFGGN